MSFRDLVGDQCGTANSLLQLSSHFNQDKGLQDQDLMHPYQLANYDDQQLNVNDTTNHFASNGPYPFCMEKLLTELDSSPLNKNQGDMSRSQSVFPTDDGGGGLRNNESVSDFANEYIKSGSKFTPVENDGYQSDIWSTKSEQESPNHEYQFNMAKMDNNANYWGSPARQDFNTNIYQDNNVGAPLTMYPRGITNIFNREPVCLNLVEVDTCSKLPRFMNLPFPMFDQGHEKFSSWASEPTETMINRSSMIDDTIEKDFSSWAGEYDAADTRQRSYANGCPGVVENEEYSRDLWSKLTERWEELNLGGGNFPWMSDFEKNVFTVQDYKFVEENSMLDNPNALEEGKKRLESGDLPGAVLCFEAAVQQNKQDIEGWQLLGCTQAKNEQDAAAIYALTECIRLDPDNLEALQELAVCYVNENYCHQACCTLKQWLTVHPKYRDIVKEYDTPYSINDENGSINIFTVKLWENVRDLCLTAVNVCKDSGEEQDADLQNALGVLFTIPCEYEKALDCFQTAVGLRPNDASLWNRYGATLANSYQPERALEAYRRTLKLRPGFIRARFNLGITCIHLKMYREAAEHLLRALNEQLSARGMPNNGESKNSIMSDSIWNALKLTLSLMERKDLLPLAEDRDIYALNREFFFGSQSESVDNIEYSVATDESSVASNVALASATADEEGE